MAGIKIVNLPAVGRDLISTDLFELSLVGGSGSRKITGQEIMNASKLNVGGTPIINGTVGRILFQGASDTLGESANLFWDNTNSILQITKALGATMRLNCTSSNPSKFQFTQELSVGVPTEIGFISNQFGTGMILQSFNSLYFNANNAEKMRIVSGTGNVLINTTTDAGYKLDVNGTARVQGKLTVSTGGMDLTGTLTNYSGYQGYGQMQLFSGSAFQMFNSANNSKISFQYTTATGLSLSINPENLSGILNGLAIGPSLVASANNNVLVGLDITPTFTNGAFTGVTNLGLRMQNGVAVFGASTYTTLLYSEIPKLFVNGGSNLLGTTSIGPSRIYFSGNNITWESTGITNNTPEWRADASGIKFGNYLTLPLRISIGGTENARFFSTGNVAIGTTTDAGFKLDVNGTTRLNGNLTFQSSAWVLDNVNAVMYRTSFNTESIAFNGSRITFTDANGFVFNSTNAGATLTASSILDIQSTTKGFLPPRMTNAQRTAIASPAVGLIVYCTDVTEGLWIYKSSGWTFIV
jgi:hypothetical protein